MFASRAVSSWAELSSGRTRSAPALSLKEPVQVHATRAFLCWSQAVVLRCDGLCDPSAEILACGRIRTEQ